MVYINNSILAVQLNQDGLLDIFPSILLDRILMEHLFTWFYVQGWRQIELALNTKKI